MIDGRFVLFSKNVRTNNDSVAISISCDVPLNISLSIPSYIVTYESLNGNAPVVVVGLSDGAADSVNISNLDTNLVYTLDIASNKESIISNVKLRLASINNGNTIGGQAKQSVELHFVHSAWKDFSYRIHNRGWGETSYSSVVSNLITDIDGDVSIANTQGLVDVIQPYWSNKQLLDWIASRAMSNEGQLDFVYSISLEGDFFFVPFSRLIDRKPVQILANSSAVDPRRIGHILHFSIQERSSKLQKQGAGGIVNSRYDYSSGQYIRNDVLYDESFGEKYSDYTFINSELSIAPLVMRHGRASEAEAITKNRIAHIVDSAERITVMAYASLTTRVGDVIELLIKSPRDFGRDKYAYSESYSGKYVVGAIKHIAHDGANKVIMQSELTLLRQGINDATDRQYVAGGNRV